MAEWWSGLKPSDWLFDGYPIRGRVMLARFANLNWAKSSVDMGPSIAGNPGPYWHVPLRKTVIDGVVYDCGDTIHRLYPRLLATKWLPLVRRACEEVAKRENSGRLRKANDRLACLNNRLSARVAELERGHEWAKSTIAERDARVVELESLLGCALTEHDGNYGRFKPHYMPHHWTHDARAQLRRTET